MKIAIIGSKGLPAKYGGVQTVVEKTAPLMVVLGHDVTVFGRYYYSEEEKGNYKGVKTVNVRGIRSKRLDTLTHSFLSTIKAAFGGYDLIIFHSHVPGYFAVIPKVFGKKTVLHIHGILSAHKHYGKWSRLDTVVLKMLIHLTSWASDRITTVSLSQKELTGKIYNREIVVIPNGIATINSSRSMHRGKYFLYVGRIIKGKGIETLIFSFLKYLELFPYAKLKIVGDHVHSLEYFNTLKGLTKNEEAIEFCGFKTGNELMELYKRAFAVINSSEFEAFGLVLLEALSFNGVVIASNIDEFKLMADGYVSFFESGNSDSLLEKMQKITIDNDYYTNLLNKSLCFPFHKYNWSNITDEYLQLYNEIINNKITESTIK